MIKIKHIRIFDTTLRDGEQAPGNTMTLEQKVDIFTQLDDLNMDIIEVGFPSSSPVDFNATEEIAKHGHKTKISAFVRPLRSDIDQSLLALRHSNLFQLQTLAVGSEIHLKYKRKMTKQEAINEILNGIEYIRAQGIEDISLGVEDASRGSLEYLKELIIPSVEAGATTIVIPDTVGCAIPEKFADLVRTIKEWVGNSIKVSVHCHNDMGLALGNSLAAIRAGADEVQTTLCGIGERAGNLACEELITVLYYHPEFYGYESRVDPKKMYQACKRLIETLNLNIAKHKSIIGDYVFSTQAGIHQHGLINNPTVYEFVEPKIFGLKRKMLIGRHSGRHVIRERLAKFVDRVDQETVEKIYKTVMHSEKPEIYNNDQLLVEMFEEYKK
ncbi:MAG TPA: pyruvate carboxyltransferase [Bacillales bacterium]|nr:pyruvate carboxyltransferase [Bacillales bacterium]